MSGRQSRRVSRPEKPQPTGEEGHRLPFEGDHREAGGARRRKERGPAVGRRAEVRKRSERHEREAHTADARVEGEEHRADCGDVGFALLE
jgi:hypothetical protein